MTEPASFREELDAVVADHRLLDHPFYVAWEKGELTLDMLRGYAAQYYQHVEAFPRYLSTVHAGTMDPEARRALARNLFEEEGGDVTHPDLWLRFAAALGLDGDDVRATEALPEVQEAIAAFLDLAARDPLAGVAALYAYESQIPAVSASKVAGLRQHYGITGEDATAYFTLHGEVDVEHADEEFDVLQRLCETPEDRARALKAAREGARAARRILDGVWRAHCGALQDAAS